MSVMTRMLKWPAGGLAVALAAAATVLAGGGGTSISAQPNAEIVTVGVNFDLTAGMTTQRGGASIAYSSMNNEYLVVWFDFRNSATTGNDIFGQRVSATGALLGGNFPVEVFADSQTFPDVAYNSVDNTFFAVWRTQQAGFFNQARGARISASGVVDADVPVASGGLEVRIAHNPTANEFLVSGRLSGIRGRRVAGNGAPTGAEFTINSNGVPNGDVVYNPNGNEYLAAWRDQSAAEKNLKGRRISPAGSLLGSDIIISSIYPSAGQATDIAFNPADNQYLVTSLTFDQSEIFGRFLNGAAEPVGAEFPIATGAGLSLPAATYIADEGVYAVAWRQGDGVAARLIAPDGGLGAATPVSGGPATGSPSLTYNSTTGEVFVVWTDNRNLDAGQQDIFGQIIDVRPPATATPTVTPTTVATVTVTPTPGGITTDVQLFDGCNLVAFVPAYALGTDLGAIAGAIAGGDPRLWFQVGPTAFVLFDPESPERSGVLVLGHEAGFICVDGASVWRRPAT